LRSHVFITSMPTSGRGREVAAVGEFNAKLYRSEESGRQGNPQVLVPDTCSLGLARA
jgi:hypothetical protein